MNNFLSDSYPINFAVESNQEKVASTAFICKYCGCITLKPDRPHRCSNSVSPDYLKGEPDEDFYQPVWMQMNVDGFTLKFEKVGYGKENYFRV